MDLTSFFETIATTHVLLTALLVGAGQETGKQILCWWKPSVKGTELFKTVMAVIPMPVGAAMGVLIIPEGGIAEPAILGIVAGLFSSTVYSTVAPYLKRAMKSNDSSPEEAS